MYPIVIAVTGASATPLAERSIQLLLKSNYNIHLIISKGAYEVWRSEFNLSIPLEPKAQESFWRDYLNTKSGKLTCHRWNNNAASIASGSFKTSAMFIIPCSMGTLGRIASGVSENLIERAADVHIKEGRKLILVPRETPLSLLHLRNLTLLAEAGVKIIPPIPAWYTKPTNLNEMIDFIIARIFDNLDMNIVDIKRWQGTLN